jgi:integrase
MAATQPIRNKQQVKALALYCLRRGQFRNHLLIVMGVHTALRISDLLRLCWNDVYDFQRGCVRSSVTIVEKKTRKSKTFPINKNVVSAIGLLAAQRPVRPHDFLMENPRTNQAISRIQAYRIIRAASEALQMEQVSCHSLRKTFGYHAWKSGASPVVIMEIYNHNSFAVTKRYLGITQDDQNQIYMDMNFSA